MKRVVISSITYRGMQPDSRACMQQLTAAGAQLVQVAGCGDMPLARSTGFSAALELAERLPELDTVLSLDDDMVFSVADAEAVIGLARETGEPVSAVYTTADQRVAAFPLGDPPYRRWLVGGGFLAVPVARLRELGERLPTVIEGGRSIKPWCCSGVHPKRPEKWTIEDFWFSLHFDGVQLAPVGVGHLKTVPLYPSADTLALIASGESLPYVRPEQGFAAG